MALLQGSLAGSLLILAAAVSRALLRRRLPKRALVALWDLAALRLLLPVTLPAALRVPLPSALSAPAGAARALAGPAAAGSTPVWAVVWAAGSAVCAAYFAAAWGYWRRAFRGARPAEHAPALEWLAAHPLRRAVALRRSGRVDAPLACGVLRPVILVPDRADWTDPAVMPYVLAHELVHIRRFDGCRKLLLAAALCLHWWNPLAWLLYALANRDMELACDEAVVRALGRRADYARALLAMEESRRGAPLYGHFSRNATRERILAIMKTKSKTFRAAALAAVLVAAAAVFLAVSLRPAQPAAVYAPNWMQPGTRIVYDDDLNYTVLAGSALTEADMAGRADIAEIGLVSESPDQRVWPGCMAEYDAHGFLQNIYFPDPDHPGAYQLQDPDFEQHRAQD